MSLHLGFREFLKAAFSGLMSLGILVMHVEAVVSQAIGGL